MIPDLTGERIWKDERLKVPQISKKYAPNHKTWMFVFAQSTEARC